MSLAQFSPLALISGLAALAAGLYALQRLRVRHSSVEVVTTMFWKQVAQDTHARELTHRFRHFLAYLLFLVLCSLLWFVTGGAQSDAEPTHQRLLLLDRSAGALVGDHWPAWKRLLREEFLAGDPHATRVMVLGAAPRSLTVPGDSVVLLDERLERIEPELAASCLEEALLDVLRTKKDLRPMDVVIVGQAPLSQRVLDLVPQEVSLSRAGLPSSSAPSALLGMGVSPAASGAWESVDLSVRVRGAGTPVLRMNGMQVQGEPALVSGRFLFNNLPASGAPFEVHLSGADPPFDSGRGRLPLRQTQAVLLDPALEGIFGAVLAAHPGLRVLPAGSDPADADLVIRRFGSGLGADLPALELVPSDQQTEALRVGFPAAEAQPAASALRSILGELGLDQLDGTGLATSLGRTLEVVSGPESVRRLGIWQELFEIEGEPLQSSRSFPVFVGRVLAWLGNTPPWVHSWRAGDPVPGLAWMDAGGLRLAGSGEDLAPPLATGIQTPTGLRQVAVFAPQDMGAAKIPAPSEPEKGDWSLGTWLLLLALGLLLWEGRLVRLGRIP